MNLLPPARVLPDMPPLSPDPPRSDRLPYLDGLRGLAALLVVVYHAWAGAGRPQWLVRFGPVGHDIAVDLLSPIGALGGSRVSLFFVVSGFLLYLPFAREEVMGAEAREGFVSFWDWLRRRFRRLSPPYYAAIALSLIPYVGMFYLREAWRCWEMHLPPRTPQFGDLAVSLPAALLFQHGLLPGAEMPDFNVPLWTITPEVQLCLTFPLLVALARCRRIGGLGTTVTLAVGASVAYRVWLYHQCGWVATVPLAASAGGSGSGGVSAAWLGSAYHCLCNNFLGRWAEFAVGMGAAGLLVRGRIPPARIILPACILCLAGFLVLRSDLVIGGWVGRMFLAMEPAPSPLADAAGGIAFALLLLSCAVTPRLARALSARPLTAVGAISYSLYLIHAPILDTITRILQAFRVASTGTPILFALDLLVALPLALLAARLFWRAFERPFLSRKRRVTLAEEEPSAEPARPAHAFPGVSAVGPISIASEGS